MVAGVAGLLIQAAKQDKRLDSILSPDGGNCLLKAILMTSATKLPYWHKGRLTVDDDHEVPLDYLQGAGMINAARAYQVLTAGRGSPGNVAAVGWDLNRLEGSQGLQQVYRIVVEEPANKMLTVTLAWNRHYDSQKYPFERLVGQGHRPSAGGVGGQLPQSERQHAAGLQRQQSGQRRARLRRDGGCVHLVRHRGFL